LERRAEMLVRFDPFGELDRLADQAFGPRRVRSAVPIDVHRIGNEFVAFLDLPGVSPETIELTLDKHDLTVTAERRELLSENTDTTQTLIRERPTGRFVRRLHLGEGLDLDQVNAEYENGVLTVRIPVAAKEQARKVEVRIVPQVPAAEESAA
jgi:HSP20 family protein